MTPIAPWRRRNKAVARDAVEQLLSKHRISELTITHVLKTDPRGDVFRAQFQGGEVVLKRYKGQDADAQVTRAMSELERLRPVMSTGNLRVALPTASWPASGLVALGFVPGQQLSDVLADAQADRAQRDALFAQTGRWASRYADADRQDGHISAQFWIKKARALDRGGVSKPARETLRMVTDRMRLLAADVKGRDLPRGYVHGDLIGRNLLVDGDLMTGVDVNGTLMRPLAWEAAHFLIWQALKPPFPADKALFQSQLQQDRDAFFAGHSSVGDDAAFRFFALLQLCLRQVTYAADPARADALDWAVAEYLD